LQQPWPAQQLHQRALHFAQAPADSALPAAGSMLPAPGSSVPAIASRFSERANRISLHRSMVPADASTMAAAASRANGTSIIATAEPGVVADAGCGVRADDKVSGRHGDASG